MDRRALLQAGAVAAAAGLLQAQGAVAAPGLKFGPAEPFSFDLLKARAKKMAAEPYIGPARPAPDIVARIDYDEWGKIKYSMETALFAEGPGRFPVSFFHLGMFFRKAVGMNMVVDGQARPIIYDRTYFDMPPGSVAGALPPGAGFAGLRFQEAREGELDWRRNDWVAFLGAAYFRAIGDRHQYGLSARAVALEIAVPGRPEEFPDFTQFYIGEPSSDDSVTLHALLEGPSLVGALRFVMTRTKAVLMDIEQALYLRGDVARFGLAPCTSMYWFSETKKETGVDWRPEVHDSDGLALWTGRGERIWRPLNNPPRITVSAFNDTDPRGFGLLQRDRAFDHYQDGVRYDLRPSLWVEPRGKWGKGAIQLAEIPTNDEIHDNIVAMWVPDAPAKAGSEVNLAYKLYWQADEPYPTPLARCVATRLGNGGQPGQPRPKGVRKFMVEFLGGPLADLPYGVKPEPVLWAARGSFSYIFCEPVPNDVAGHWRAQFDLTVDGADPVEMRLYLRAGEQTLSETWLFQYQPF